MLRLLFQGVNLVAEFLDQFFPPIRRGIATRTRGALGVLRLMFGPGATRVLNPFGMSFWFQANTDPFRVSFRPPPPKKENLRGVIPPEKNKAARPRRSISRDALVRPQIQA